MFDLYWQHPAKSGFRTSTSWPSSLMFSGSASTRCVAGFSFLFFSIYFDLRIWSAANLRYHSSCSWAAKAEAFFLFCFCFFQKFFAIFCLFSRYRDLLLNFRKAWIHLLKNRKGKTKHKHKHCVYVAKAAAAVSAHQNTAHHFFSKIKTYFS